MKVDSSRVARFNHFWEDLYKAFPAARAAAVIEMGKVVKADLDVQVTAQGVNDTFGHIRNVQELRYGSKGGYASVTPVARGMVDRYGKTKTWKGQQVSTRQVTKWLEKGHGARKPSGAAKSYVPQINKAGVDNKGHVYVKGHLFYSWTKLRALDHALKAADKVLSKIADEVDY